MTSVEDSERSISPALSLQAPRMSPPLEETVAESVQPSPPGRLAPSPTCKMCKKKHPLRFCRKFKSLRSDQRLRAVIKLQHCVRCLSSTHTTSRCQSLGSCNQCKGRHHTLLHDDRIDSPRDLIRRSPSVVRQKPLLSSSLRRSLKEAVPHAIPSVLLPTCECMLWIHGTQLRVRVLLDSCSPCYLVVQRLTTSYGNFDLPVEDGGVVETVLTSIHSSQLRLSLTAKVVRQIRCESPSASCSPNIKSQFERLKLADELFFEARPFQIVLGVSTYNLIMRPMVLSQPGFPTAQDSTLGWVLSGPCA